MLKKFRDRYALRNHRNSNTFLNRVVGIGFVFLMALAAVVFSSCGNSGFAGSRVKTPDSYTLDIRQMNGTDSHTLQLHSEDILQIDFSVEKGSIKLDILAPDGNPLYSGNGKDCNSFELNISEDGIYTISVEAKNAKGNIRVIKKSKV